jgi:hypothetical protein
MGQELGRISGVMLKDNLERLGIDLTVDTDLLKLDVNNKSISINSLTTDVDTALFVNSAIKTTGLTIDTRLKIDSIDITTSNNTILSKGGDLKLSAANSIITDNIRTDDLNFDDNTISSTSSNQSIELRPDGLGEVNLSSTLNVTGNLHATGDILIEGTVVFGDTDDANIENVKINAAIGSNLIPNLNEQFSLGSSTNKWLDIYPDLLNGEIITAAAVQANGINLVLRQGNTWYVSQNGSDTNHGDHEANTFRSIKHALENVDLESGDTVIVYPGTYEEITPLVVPQGVSIRGTSLRSVKVTASSTTIDNNVFELNGETTVSDITVADFRYDEVTDTGYAFSFADNFTVTSRSPYIQNVSVITSGSVTTLSDPRGFASGDAGKGALVDGAKALPTSKEASMLFHSVTFITPGVDALTMTNGVRVEWLNSFVYFADKAMYAIAGVGRYDAIRGITRFGAEVRSIGSACVYGNYGSWAEGQGTLMYLINHNFGYVGSGKDFSNDTSLVIQANEVVELDSGKIYYQGYNKGKWRVGDAFSVDHETGFVSINGVSVTGTGVSSILFGSETSDTVINASVVGTGNIKFSGNTLTSSFGDVNLLPGVGKLNLEYDVSAKQNISIDNNFSLKGTLTLGNQPIDITEFNAPANSDILPSADRLFRLGNDFIFSPEITVPLSRWNKVITQLIEVDGNIRVFDNVIQTSQSNSDLELRTHGAGNILLETNELTITNQLTVNGDTSLQSIGINGDINQTGDILQTGDRSISNGAAITGNVSATVQAVFETITISAGQITTTASNADLELRAAGIGQIVVPTSNVLIQNNLTVSGIMVAGDAVITGDIVANVFDNSDITITTNRITTNVGNNNLILGAHGVGTVDAPAADVEIIQDLQIDGLSTLNNISILGDMLHIGNIVQTGSTVQTGNYALSNNLTVTEDAQFNNIAIVNNNVSTTVSNSDLELTAAGTGQVVIPTSDVIIQNDLTVSGTMTAGDAIITNQITSTQFDSPDISFYSNTIITTGLDQNLIIGAHGVGTVTTETSDVTLGQDLQVDGLSTLSNVVTVGDTVHNGTFNLTGDASRIGNYSLSNNLTVTLDAQFANIEIDNNVITTTISSSDLELRASGAGIVKVDDIFRITNNLTVDGVSTTNGLSNSGTITSDKFSDGNILVTDNYITTTSGNLILAPSLNGIVSVAANNVLIDNNLQVEGISTLSNTVVGNTLTTQVNQNLSGTSSPTGFFYYGWQILNPGQTVPTFSVIQPGWTVVGQPTWVVTVVGDGVTNYDITITGGSFASGGTYSFTGPNLATLTVAGTINRTGNTTETGNYTLSTNLTVSGTASLTNIDIDNNIITTTDSNSDLELRASGTGQVVIDDVFRIAQAAQIETLVTNGVTNSGTVTSDVFTNGAVLFNDNYFTTTGNADLVLQAPSTRTVYLPFDPLLVDNNLSVVGTTSIRNTVINGDILYSQPVYTITPSASSVSEGSPLTFTVTTNLPANTVLYWSATTNSVAAETSPLLMNRAGNVVQTGNTSISTNLTVTGTTALFPDVSIINNVIKTLSTNSDLELRAVGSGIVRVAADNVAISQQLSVNGTTATSVINNSGTVYSDQFTNGDIVIKDNYITTTSGTTNLRLLGNSLGGPRLEKIKFNANTISTESLNDDIVLTVSSGSVLVTGTNALKIPVGTAAARVSNNTGDVRLDTTDSLFSGWNGARVTFGGLYSTNRLTRVAAHPTNNTINFVTNSVTSMTLAETGITPNALLVNNNLFFNNNTISATTANSSVFLSPNGTGQLVLENIEIRENTITNLKSTAPLVLQNTGFGYVAFGGTGALAIPAGPTISVPPPSTELGDFRFNTTLSIAEVFNGVEYVSLSGGGNTSQLTADEIAEITNLWGLILG